MQRLLTILAMVGLALLVAGPAFAQQQQQQGQVQGQAGVKVGQTGVQAGFQAGITQQPWFSNPQVRSELKLTDDQFNKLNQTWTQSYTTFNTGVTGLGNVSVDQRTKSMNDLSATFNTTINNQAKTVLSPEQYTRYQQLHLQHGGISFMNDPQIMTQFNFTPEQTRELQTIQTDFNTQVSKIDWSNPNQAMTTYYGLLPRVWARIRGNLTPAQVQVYDRVYGQPYNFTVTTTPPR